MTHESQLEVKREKLLEYWHAVREYQRRGVSLKAARELVRMDLEEEKVIQSGIPATEVTHVCP